MALFRRNTVSDASEYLKATDVVSRPVAILMTVVGLIFVGGLLVSLFLGGKWVYDRAVNGDEASVATTETVEVPSGDSPNDQAAVSEGDQPATEETPAETTPETLPSDTSNESTTPTTTETPAATTQTPASSTETPAPTTQTPAASTTPATTESQTAATSQPIPNTGPGSLIAGMLAVFALGVAGHQFALRRLVRKYEDFETF